MNDSHEDFYSDDTPNLYAQDPYTNTFQIDAKLISSDYKNQKITVQIPTYKKILVAVLEKDAKGKTKLVDGYPVAKIRKARVIADYKTKEMDFPIKNIHNDSVTSSILTDSDVEQIRVIDDSLYDLMLDMVKDPRVNYLKTIHRLNGIKASIVDSSKGRWGRSSELAKTNISKGESKTYAYHDQKKFEEYEQRKQQGGIFGFVKKIF